MPITHCLIHNRRHTGACSQNERASHYNASPRGRMAMTTEPKDRGQLQACLRLLIKSSKLRGKPPQKLFAGSPVDRHSCVVCGAPLTQGAVEYEVSVDDHVVYIHPLCFKLWPQLEEQSA
jgi:hypothetical protein